MKTIVMASPPVVRRALCQSMTVTDLEIPYKSCSPPGQRSCCTEQVCRSKHCSHQNQTPHDRDCQTDGLNVVSDCCDRQKISPKDGPLAKKRNHRGKVKKCPEGKFMCSAVGKDVTECGTEMVKSRANGKEEVVTGTGQSLGSDTVSDTVPEHGLDGQLVERCDVTEKSSDSVCCNTRRVIAVTSGQLDVTSQAERSPGELDLFLPMSDSSSPDQSACYSPPVSPPGCKSPDDLCESQSCGCPQFDVSSCDNVDRAVQSQSLSPHGGCTSGRTVSSRSETQTSCPMIECHFKDSLCPESVRLSLTDWKSVDFPETTSICHRWSCRHCSVCGAVEAKPEAGGSEVVDVDITDSCQDSPANQQQQRDPVEGKTETETVQPDICQTERVLPGSAVPAQTRIADLFHWSQANLGTCPADCQMVDVIPLALSNSQNCPASNSEGCVDIGDRCSGQDLPAGEAHTGGQGDNGSSQQVSIIYFEHFCPSNYWDDFADFSISVGRYDTDSASSQDSGSKQCFLTIPDDAVAIILDSESVLLGSSSVLTALSAGETKAGLAGEKLSAGTLIKNTEPELSSVEPATEPAVHLISEIVWEKSWPWPSGMDRSIMQTLASWPDQIAVTSEATDEPSQERKVGSFVSPTCGEDPARSGHGNLATEIMRLRLAIKLTMEKLKCQKAGNEISCDETLSKYSEVRKSQNMTSSALVGDSSAPLARNCGSASQTVVDISILQMAVRQLEELSVHIKSVRPSPSSPALATAVQPEGSTHAVVGPAGGGHRMDTKPRYAKCLTCGIWDQVLRQCQQCDRGRYCSVKCRAIDFCLHCEFCDGRQRERRLRRLGQTCDRCSNEEAGGLELDTTWTSDTSRAAEVDITSTADLSQCVKVSTGTEPGPSAGWEQVMGADAVVVASLRNRMVVGAADVANNGKENHSSVSDDEDSHDGDDDESGDGCCHVIKLDNENVNTDSDDDTHDDDDGGCDRKPARESESSNSVDKDKHNDEDDDDDDDGGCDMMKLAGESMRSDSDCGQDHCLVTTTAVNVSMATATCDGGENGEGCYVTKDKAGDCTVITTVHSSQPIIATNKPKEEHRKTKPPSLNRSIKAYARGPCGLLAADNFLPRVADTEKIKQRYQAALVKFGLARQSQEMCTGGSSIQVMGSARQEESSGPWGVSVDAKQERAVAESYSPQSRA